MGEVCSPTSTCGICITVNGERVQVNLQLLFQRQAVFAIDDKLENHRSLFEYELCSYPAALFDSSALPRKANKPVLADAIWELLQRATAMADSMDEHSPEPTMSG